MTLLARPSAQVRTCTFWVSIDFASFEKHFHKRDPETQKYLLSQVSKVHKWPLSSSKKVWSFHTASQFYLPTSREERGSRKQYALVGLKQQRWREDEHTCLSLFQLLEKQQNKAKEKKTKNTIGWEAKKQQTFISYTSEAGYPQSRCWQIWCLTGAHFFTAVFSPRPHKAEEAREPCRVTFTRTVISLCGLYPPKLITSKKPHLQISPPWGLGFQLTDYEETHPGYGITQGHVAALKSKLRFYTYLDVIWCVEESGLGKSEHLWEANLKTVNLSAEDLWYRINTCRQRWQWLLLEATCYDCSWFRIVSAVPTPDFTASVA